MPPLTLKADAPQVVMVIYTETTRRGRGVPGSPVRRMKQVHSLDGTLLTQEDPFANLSSDDVLEALKAVDVTLSVDQWGRLLVELEKRIEENLNRR